MLYASDFFAHWWITYFTLNGVALTHSRKFCILHIFNSTQGARQPLKRNEKTMRHPVVGWRISVGKRRMLWKLNEIRRPSSFRIADMTSLSQRCRYSYITIMSHSPNNGKNKRKIFMWNESRQRLFPSFGVSAEHALNNVWWVFAPQFSFRSMTSDIFHREFGKSEKIKPTQIQVNSCRIDGKSKKMEYSSSRSGRLHLCWTSKSQFDTVNLRASCERTKEQCSATFHYSSLSRTHGL